MTQQEYIAWAEDYGSWFCLSGDDDGAIVNSWYQDFSDLGVNIDQLHRAANQIKSMNLRPFAADHRLPLFRAVNAIMVSDSTRAMQRDRVTRDAAGACDSNHWRKLVEAKIPGFSWGRAAQHQRRRKAK